MIETYELDAGSVLSIINAGIIMIQYTLPLFIGILLAGVVGNASSANTWSVVSTILHNSWLHAALRSDSVPSKYIARPVLLISYLSILAAGLMTLTSVLIPLGVKDDYKGVDVPGLRFELAVDNDSFSLGTAKRDWYALTRVCGVGEDKCPGQESETGEEDEGMFAVAPWKPQMTAEDDGPVWVESLSTSARASTTSTSTTRTSTSTSTSTGTTATSTAPVSSTPSPATVTQAPPVSEAAPVSSTPSPAAVTQAPPVSEAAPVSSTPSPAAVTQAPPVSEAAPVSSTPSPAAVTQAPPVSEAAPVSSTPSPAAVTQTPTASQAAPVSEAPPVSQATPVSEAPPVSEAAPVSQATPVSEAVRVSQAPPVSEASSMSQVAVPEAIRSTAATTTAGGSEQVVTIDFRRPTSIPRARLTRRATVKKYRIGGEVPAPLLALFGNTSYYGASVASVFDIQFRNYIILQKDEHRLSNGLRYAIGQFRFLETLILTQGYKLIEGLIVDTTGGGGVGFRTHAVPDRAQRKYGASWEETLLWVAPETVCVPNNVTMQVTTNDEGGSMSELVDMGGFSGLAGAQDPQVAPDAEGVPDLARRAWNGAYFFNKDVAAAVGAGGGEGQGKKEFLITGEGQWTEKLREMGASLGGNLFAVHRMPLGASTVDGIMRNITSIDSHCAGLTADTPSGAPLITCGLIIGAPRRDDGESTPLTGAYNYPLYTCATAIRASLRTTHITSTGATRNLAAVTINNSTPIASKPLWGVENRANLAAARISPLWGLLHPDREHAANVTARRAPYLYLPAGQGGDGITDSLAGTGAYQYAASFMYMDTSPMTPDYSGRTNYALYRQWDRFTADAGSAAYLPGLIWTDVFANLVTSVSTGGKGVGLVRVDFHVVRYQVRYAVPGMLLVLLWLGVLGAAITLFVRRRVRVKQVRMLLNQLSTGRLVVNMLAGGKNGALPPKQWAKEMGRTVVGLQCCHPDEVGVLTKNSPKTGVSTDELTNEDYEREMDGMAVQFVGGWEEERHKKSSWWPSWMPGRRPGWMPASGPDGKLDDGEGRRPEWTPGRMPDWMATRSVEVPVEGWEKRSEIMMSDRPGRFVEVPMVPPQAPEDRRVMDVLVRRK